MKEMKKVDIFIILGLFKHFFIFSGKYIIFYGFFTFFCSRDKFGNYFGVISHIFYGFYHFYHYYFLKMYFFVLFPFFFKQMSFLLYIQLYFFMFLSPKMLISFFSPFFSIFINFPSLIQEKPY